MGIVLTSPTKKEGVINLPLIDFCFFNKEIKISQYDYLIFTSKTSVQALEKTNQNWKKIPALTVGEKTKQEVESFGGKVVFTGNGYGKSLHSEILKHKSSRILFVRGKEVANDLKAELSGEVAIEEAIVYETTCNKPHLPKEEFLKIIFTSPSTVECFFKNYTWLPTYKAVAIGSTTKEAFKDKAIEVFTPKETSIDACIDLAKAL